MGYISPRPNTEEAFLKEHLSKNNFTFKLQIAFLVSYSFTNIHRDVCYRSCKENFCNVNLYPERGKDSCQLVVNSQMTLATIIGTSILVAIIVLTVIVCVFYSKKKQRSELLVLLFEEL